MEKVPLCCRCAAVATVA